MRASAERIFYPESPLFTLAAVILLLQIGVAYIAFIVPNHLSFDMFVFALMAVICGRYGLVRAVQTHASKLADRLSYPAPPVFDGSFRSATELAETKPITMPFER